MKHSRRISLFVAFAAFCLFSVGEVSMAFAEDCSQQRKTLQAPDSFLKQTNPLGVSQEAVSAGEKLYHTSAKPLACVHCHGASGKGDGAMAKAMNPKPRDFSCAAMMSGIPDGQLFWVIKNGSRGTGMMAFPALSDDQTWQLVSYIRQFPK